MAEQYSLEFLENLPTITTAQSSDLKIDTHESMGRFRYWLSRCTVADGEPYDNKVTIERLLNGRWTVIDTYQAS
jgi:hypothetical protein